MASAVPYTDNLEQNTQSQAFKHPFTSAPEICGENTFVLDTNSNILLVAENLASEAKALIHTLKTTLLPSDIHNQYQIELRKLHIHDDHSSTYKMSLRIDSVLWFKQHALNGSNVQDLEELYNIGVHYGEKVKNEAVHESGSINEHEIVRIPIANFTLPWCYMEEKGRVCTYKDDIKHKSSFEHYQWCVDENYGTTGKCKLISAGHDKNVIHTLEIKKSKIPYYQCRNQSTKLDRKQVFCLFQVNPNFWIYANKVMKPSCYPFFIAAARNDATPVITLNPVKHCSNEQYVQTCDAWQAVLQTLTYMQNQLNLDKLPLDRIYINFGNWTTQKANDLLFRDYHAHINIVLTRQTIEKINDINLIDGKQRRGQGLFPSLVGSMLPSKPHRLDDSVKFIEYMNNQMTHVLFKRNLELERSISTLKIELEELKKEHEKTRQLIFGPTNGPEETEEVVYGIAEDDAGTEITNKTLSQELPSNSFSE